MSFAQTPGTKVRTIPNYLVIMVETRLDASPADGAIPRRSKLRLYVEFQLWEIRIASGSNLAARSFALHPKEHQINDHPGNRDVQPQGIGPARDHAMPVKLPAQSARESDQHQRHNSDGKNRM
jgi:hypothetical protein